VIIMADAIRIDSTQAYGPVAGNRGQQNAQVCETVFADLLNDASQVKFSNHAQKRMQNRSIDLGSDEINRLSSAVDKAQAHGARESLILMDDLAFIVNVPERTVVTTLDMNRSKQGVFTQIDSVVFADSSSKDIGLA